MSVYVCECVCVVEGTLCQVNASLEIQNPSAWRHNHLTRTHAQKHPHTYRRAKGKPTI